MVLQFLQRAAEQVGGWLYLIAGFLAFAEAALMIGLAFPGETALLEAGLAAHQGYIGLWPMIAVAVVAAVLLGDSVGYEVGRTLATCAPRPVGPTSTAARQMPRPARHDRVRPGAQAWTVRTRWTISCR